MRGHFWWIQVFSGRGEGTLANLSLRREISGFSRRRFLRREREQEGENHYSALFDLGVIEVGFVE